MFTKLSMSGVLAAAVVGTSMVAVQAESAVLRYQKSGDWTALSDANPDDVLRTPGWAANPVGPAVGSLPGASDDARINFGGNTVTVTTSVPTVDRVQIGVDESGIVTVNAGGVLTANSLRAGNNNAAATGTLNVNDGGIVNANGIFWVGKEGSTGVVNINSGGTVNVASHLWWGEQATGNATVNINGTLNQTGGILGLGTTNAVDPSLGTAMVTVGDGGIFSLNNISSAVGLPSIQAGSLIDITGTGQILLPGDFVATLNDYVTAGKIVGEGLIGNVVVDLTSNDGFTTAYIPEPGSVMLIGAGAFGLLVRRKRA